MIDAPAHVHRNADGRIVSPSHAALNSTVLHAGRRFSMRLSTRGGPGSPEEAKLLQTPSILTVETSKCMALRDHGWYATASVIRNVGILAGDVLTRRLRGMSGIDLAHRRTDIQTRLFHCLTVRLCDSASTLPRDNFSPPYHSVPNRGHFRDERQKFRPIF